MKCEPGSQGEWLCRLIAFLGLLVISQTAWSQNAMAKVDLALLVRENMISRAVHSPQYDKGEKEFQNCIDRLSRMWTSLQDKGLITVYRRSCEQVMGQVMDEEARRFFACSDRSRTIVVEAVTEMAKQMRIDMLFDSQYGVLVDRQGLMPDITQAVSERLQNGRRVVCW